MLSRKIRERLRCMSIALAAAATLGLTGCATHYVDGSTKEVSAEQFRKPDAPQEVQVVFEFQTKGVPNAAATQQLKTQVLQKVKDSGLFTAVSEQPVPQGAMLSLKLNNVVLTDDAFSKGFATGLTFGLAGSQVSDGYICTVSYLGNGQAAPITKSARHAIHTTLGAAKVPGNAEKAATIQEAVTKMTSQVVSTALNDLSQDPAFASKRN
ncbi:hypothetical protein [Variovorax saccharolyticus]|uniref:hypothetical protein n=1 Tax=Variovorax saccharolyticus TaxID=3053516 RepID=UPI0025758C51|nr:hypothetical protein [Variovorax sp. J31P216]MDM0025797.1 hypothetical protein [Variovorax sp. J31P216]